MLHLHCRILEVQNVAPEIFVLSFNAPGLAASVAAGQFVNIRIRESYDPLLRRPFSVYRTDGDTVEVLFQKIGKGTALLADLEAGEDLDIIGPLGHGFRLDDPSFQTAVLVGGGLGVAPLPIATAALRRAGKRIITLLGARSASLIVDAHLENLHVATDDGTLGLRGNVVDLAARHLTADTTDGLRLFACGPMPMLRAIAEFARSRQIACEVSLEGQMACGIGICQGCPVELAGQERRYALMCKDGPVFDTRDIVI
jgi:dihydroorotate dehydrogenase electron transfer subunit